MTVDFNQFIKNISKIDLEDICSEWQWLLQNKYSPIIVSCSGDMFLIDKAGAVSWLDTGIGQLKQIANNVDQFNSALQFVDNIDNWFLASTILELIENGVLLKENQVYSYKQMPILNGDYSVTNFEATDISVHFSITGQICRQVKDLPNGTKINNITVNPFTKKH